MNENHPFKVFFVIFQTKLAEFFSIESLLIHDRLNFQDRPLTSRTWFTWRPLHPHKGRPSKGRGFSSCKTFLRRLRLAIHHSMFAPPLSQFQCISPPFPLGRQNFGRMAGPTKSSRLPRMEPS